MKVLISLRGLEELRGVMGEMEKGVKKVASIDVAVSSRSHLPVLGGTSWDVRGVTG